MSVFLNSVGESEQGAETFYREPDPEQETVIKIIWSRSR